MGNPIWSKITTADVLELTRSLVRIPSITEQEGLRISEFVRDWLAERGLQARLVPAADDRASVVCEVGAGGPVLVLNAHLDTKWVEGMTVDPFAAMVRDGRLYGRGSCDTKGAVAGMMLAASAVAEAGGPNRGTLRLVFEVGEEGRQWAADQLWEEGYLKADWVVVGEPSDGRIQIGNRGRVGGLVRTFGRSTHTATAEAGINAIESMCRAIQAFLSLPYRQDNDPHWGRAPLNFWKIESKGWEATVPYECTAWFDTRISPHVTPDEVLRQMRTALADLSERDPSFRAELPDDSVWPRLPAMAIPEDHELVRWAVSSLRQVTGREPKIGANPAMTMAHVVISRGVPAVIFGPGEMVRAHTADESVGIEELGVAARFYAALVAEVLGVA